MWWVLPAFVAGLIASSFMIIYWFYRLREAIAKKGSRYTSRLVVFVWIAVFFGLAIGLTRMSTVIEEGSTIDSMLVYTSAILYLIALIAVATGMILDAVIRIRRVEKTEGLSKQKQQLKTQTQNTTQSLFNIVYVRVS